MVESRGCVHRERVYRWFSSLSSARRAEFLVGLLDLCVPIELRFLGSCLEDLARKDFHSLRDAEIKANSPTDLSALCDVTDQVARSKLLVSLALLGSDNRAAAAVLYRILTQADTVMHSYGLPLEDGRSEDELVLLFTMASNHPAFSFHQKQLLRKQLGHLQDVLQASSRGGAAAGGGGGDVPAGGPACGPVCQAQPHPVCPQQSLCAAACSPVLPLSACQRCLCWSKSCCTESGSGHADLSDFPQELQPDPRPPPKRHHVPTSLPTCHNQEAAAGGSRQGKAGKVIEKVQLRGTTHKTEENPEFVFEVSCSDGSVSSVVRTPQEVTELISQLSQALPEEHLENLLPQCMELDPRCLSALPPHVVQHRSFQMFFTSGPPSPRPPPAPPTSSLSPPPSSIQSSAVVSSCPLTSISNLGFMQFKGANRAIYRVASVQPVVPHLSVIPPMLPPSLPVPHTPPQMAPLPPPGAALSTRGSTSSGSDSASSVPYSYSQLYMHPPTCSPSLPHSLAHSHSLSLSHSLAHSQPRSPLLSQAQPHTPEQSSILDWLRRLRLHKYYPVFKQLTMEEFLALTEEDLNKYDLTQGAKKKLKTQLELQKSADREMKMETRSHTGVARVTPSTHCGPSAPPVSSAASELRVDVDGASPVHQATSTDGSSSSGYSSSSCSPRTPHGCDSREHHRRGTEKDRSGAAPSRPTAQVLPVQTDPVPHPPPPSCSSPHLAFGLPPSPFHPQYTYPQTLLSVSNPARILAAPRKPRPAPLCADDRSPLPPPGGGAGGAYGGVRLENVFPGLSMERPCVQDAAAGGRSLTLGLMVETSCALTSTSNSLHHVSHPPLHFHLSSSSSSCSSSCTKSPSHSANAAGGAYVSMATANSVPVAAISGNSYYPPQPACSPSPSGTAPQDQGYAHSPSGCVCSSCGCHGNCGAYGALPGYAAAGYLQPSLFTLSPLLHLGPLIPSSSASPFSYRVMVPPPLYGRSPMSPDQQQAVGLFQPHSILGSEGQKLTGGTLSCYNCGAGGHRAEECKLPPMDSQQGTFRLKFSPHPEPKDSGSEAEPSQRPSSFC